MFLYPHLITGLNFQMFPNTQLGKGITTLCNDDPDSWGIFNSIYKFNKQLFTFFEFAKVEIRQYDVKQVLTAQALHILIVWYYLLLPWCAACTHSEPFDDSHHTRNLREFSRKTKHLFVRGPDTLFVFWTRLVATLH